MDIFLEVIENNIIVIKIIAFLISSSILLLIALFIVQLAVKKINQFFINRFSSVKSQEIYKKAVVSQQKWLVTLTILSVIDLTLVIVSTNNFLKYLEYPLGLLIAIGVVWLGSELFDQFFAAYMSDVAINRKVNGELLVVTNIIADGLIFLIVLSIFAEVHQINILAITASLGIGGIAIAFAAQQTLSQLFGGIVLFIDRPFVVDDYIGLPDGTFGKVESIGLRSTKVRNSGKGTISIIPNNSLTQVTIENFSGAQKIVALFYLTFARQISEQEKALIRQEILKSGQGIFGIDSRNTEVSFSDFSSNEGSLITQAQVSFFILGSGELSMEMRGNLLNIAKQNMILNIQQYGIDYNLEEKSINVNAPITL
ncbi:MAG TPA: hypothetical protein DCF68_07010 [Cyanothece sp. UBA12306]|nr:hypothetical protein [Cyanothece sp. UBA12306]